MVLWKRNVGLLEREILTFEFFLGKLSASWMARMFSIAIIEG